MSEMERNQLVLEDQAPEDSTGEEPVEKDKWNDLKDADTINKEITALETKIESDVAAAKTALDKMTTNYDDLVEAKERDNVIASADKVL